MTAYSRSGHLIRTPGNRIHHEHPEGGPCIRGIGGCYERRSLLGRLADLVSRRRWPHR